MTRRKKIQALIALSVGTTVQAASISPAAKSFIETHCAECHDTETKKAGLDLATLEYSPRDKANFATWVKVHDRVEAAEMPPKKKARQGKPWAEQVARVKSTSVSKNVSKGVKRVLVWVVPV